jgi:hypothetical protein
MTTEALTTEVPLKISVGHLLLVWDILANRLAGLPVLETLGDEEQRAMAALQDLCENTLQANGFAARPKADWDRLLRAARAHVRGISIEYDDSDEGLI